MRRSFVAERYAPLIEALYDGSTEKYVETEVTYEDGRKGMIRATVRIVDAQTSMRRRDQTRRPPNERALRAARLGLADDGIASGRPADGRAATSRCAFGGVKAITDISFDIRKGEIRAIIGPNGAGKTSMLNVINGFYTPQQGTIVFRGQDAARDEAAPRGAPGHRAHLPERGAVQGHVDARQHHGRALRA